MQSSSANEACHHQRLFTKKNSNSLPESLLKDVDNVFLSTCALRKIVPEQFIIILLFLYHR